MKLYVGIGLLVLLAGCANELQGVGYEPYSGFNQDSNWCISQNFTFGADLLQPHHCLNKTCVRYASGTEQCTLDRIPIPLEVQK